MSKLRSTLGFLGFAAATAAAPLLSIRSNPADPGIRRWYRSLDKPPFTPPEAAFGPVWTTLYALIAASGWRVWKAPASPERSRSLALWTAQLGLNAAWTPLFFGRRKTKLALADLLALVGATAGYTAAAREVDGPAAAMMAPYLGWLALASALNAEVVRRNG